MKVHVNGEVRELPDGLTVGAFLERAGAARSGIAVARNDAVVRRTEFDAQPIEEGDRIEIIRAVAGG